MTITETLENRILEDAKKNEREPGISPSNIGSCLRKLMLMERGAPHTDFSVNQLKVFGMGYLVEHYVLDRLDSIMKHRQLKVEWRGFQGTLDCIVEMDGKLFLIDTKSVKSGKFDYLDREGVDEKYAMQLTIYWLGAKAQGIELEDRVCLFYLDKENCLTKEVWFAPSEYVAKVNAKIEFIEFARKSHDLPAEKTEIDWECFSVSQKFKTVKVWCQYIENCPSICSAHKKAVEDMESKKTKKPKEA